MRYVSVEITSRMFAINSFDVVHTYLPVGCRITFTRKYTYDVFLLNVYGGEKKRCLLVTITPIFERLLVNNTINYSTNITRKCEDANDFSVVTKSFLIARVKLN